MMNPMNMMNQMSSNNNMLNNLFNQNNNIPIFQNDLERKNDTEILKINLHTGIKPQKEFNFNTLITEFNDLRINLYRCSMNLSQRIKLVKHPVLETYYIAFLHHYPVVLSPDILWMLILEGFNHNVHANSKELRNKFVKGHTDKIVITQEANGEGNINQISQQRWGDIFKDFVEQTRKYIDGNVIHLFTPYFSTTTEDIEYACKLSTISIILPYIKFIKKLKDEPIGGCGFPYIKLQGTLQDYKQLKIKVESLKGYLIDDWLNKIIIDIDKIIETKKGMIDKKFWDNMITNQKREYIEDLRKSVSGVTFHRKVKREEIKIFGWIFDFFPFKIVPSSDIRNLKGRYYEVKEKIARNNIKIYHNPDFNELPEEMINIDATYRNRLGQSAELGINTGFLGYSMDEDQAFKPEIGWYFYIKNDPNNLIKKYN